MEIIKHTQVEWDNLIDALENLVEGYTNWEADILSNNVFWWPYAEKDALSGKLYEDMLLLQGKRNEARELLNKIKETTCQH